MTAIPGLHHVTAISGPPHANIAFYTRSLGQRLVKQTVNFDSPDTWHLYYGDRTGSPGSIMTFFPVPGAPPGRIGTGMASAHAYAVAAGRFDALADRLRAEGHATTLTERFGARVLALADPDGAPVELVETGRPAAGETEGLHSVTLLLADPGPTARILTDIFGWAEAGHETGAQGERLRLTAPGDAPGASVDLLRRDGAPRGRSGAGTIHHVAFRARTDAEQRHWIDRLAAAGHRTTPPIDRQYFTAIYFREPGGVLFEIATDPPGFAVDEPVEALGAALKLPPQHEPYRDRIAAALPPLAAAV